MAPDEPRPGARARTGTNSGTAPGTRAAPAEMRGPFQGLWPAAAAALPGRRRRGAGALEAADQSQVPSAGQEGDWELVTEAEVEAEAEAEAATAAEQPESGGGGVGGAGDAAGGEGGVVGAGESPLAGMGAGQEDLAMPRDAGGQPLGGAPGGPGDAMDVSGPTPDLAMGPAPAPTPAPLPLALPAPVASSAEDGQSKEDSQTGTFRWCIENFSKNTERKLYSHPPFTAGGYNW